VVDVFKTMKTIAVHSTKGGTGKSFTSQSLVFGLQRFGKRVLSIDLDQQANLTNSLLGCQTPNNISLFLTGKASLESLVRPVLPQWGKASIIAAGIELNAAIKTLIVEDMPGKELLLNEALRPLSEAFDYCVIDCPPARDVIVFNAFAAADVVYVPVQPALYDSHGIIGTFDLVNLISSRLNMPVQVGGIVCNRWGRDKLSKDIYKDLQAKYPTLLCKATIRDSAKVREAITGRLPLVTHVPTMPIADDVNQLILEVFHGSQKWSSRVA
jgi:chromosome partitioning protein